MERNIQLYLAGGGSERDSLLLDQQFSTALDATKPLVYLPNATQSRTYEECLTWLKSAFLPFNITNIEMWDDLKPHLPVGLIAGIYIGGGNTTKLLNDLKHAGFDRFVIEAVNKGVPVYGGSAGAIIFGEDIRSAPESADLTALAARGLGVVQDHVIFCHYGIAGKDSAKSLTRRLGHSVIAIPEKSGVIYDGRNFTSFGTESTWLLSGEDEVELEPRKGE